MNTKDIFEEYKILEILLIGIACLLLMIDFTYVDDRYNLPNLYKKGFLETIAGALLIKFFMIKRSKYISKKIYNIYTILLAVTIILVLIAGYYTFNEILLITWGWLSCAKNISEV